MADTKISAMTTASTLTGGEIIPLVQSGNNVQQTVTNIVSQALNVTPVTVAQGGTNATTASAARTNLGLGTMAVENSNNVSITGGAIDGTVLGGTTPAAASVTTLNASGTTTLNSALTGFLKAASGVVSSVTTIPWSVITGAPATVAPIYGAFHQDGNTTLTANITNSQTTPISVASTANFPTSGYIIIDNEIISYTATTATTFGGTITRGVLGSSTSAHSSGAYAVEAQGTGASTTIGAIRFNFTDFSNGVSINVSDNTQVVFSTPGTYNVAISLQLINYTGTIDDITVWFSQGGTDIPSSASIEAVPYVHANVPGSLIMSYNIFVRTTVANDYIQIKWTTDTGNGVIATYAPGVNPTHPSSPGVILTVNQVG